MIKRAGPPPYYHRYVDDFGEGVQKAGMSLEQIGFYCLFLDEQWRAQGPLDADPRKLAKLFRLDLRRCERLLRELLALGPSKIACADGKVWNPRMQKEIAKHARWAARQLAQQSENPAPRQAQLPWLAHPGGGPRRQQTDLAGALANLGRRLKTG